MISHHRSSLYLTLALFCLFQDVIGMELSGFLDSKSGKDLDNPFFSLSKSSSRSSTSSSKATTTADMINAFKVSPKTIIRTKESRSMGAKYLNESSVKSRDECLSWCWKSKTQDSSCNLAVFEEIASSPLSSCYLFDCGSIENFKCKFTSHDSYSSSFLNRALDDLSDWRDQSDHENQLMSLKNKKDSFSLLPSSSSPPSPLNDKNPKLSKCQHFQFACKNSSECIAIYNVCDGIPQCPDASDESPELKCQEKSGKTGSLDGEEMELEDVARLTSGKSHPQDHRPIPVESSTSSPDHVSPPFFLESPSVYHYPKASSSSSSGVSQQQSPSQFVHHRYSSFIPAADSTDNRHPEKPFQSLSSQQQSPSSEVSSKVNYLHSYPPVSSSQQQQSSSFFRGNTAIDQYFNPPSSSDVESGFKAGVDSQRQSLSPSSGVPSSYFDADNFFPRDSGNSPASPLLWSVIASEAASPNNGMTGTENDIRRGSMLDRSRLSSKDNNIFDANSLLVPKGFDASSSDSDASSFPSLMWPPVKYPDPEISVGRQPMIGLSAGNRLGINSNPYGMNENPRGKETGSYRGRYNDPIFVPAPTDSTTGLLRKQIFEQQQQKSKSYASGISSDPGQQHQGSKSGSSSSSSFSSSAVIVKNRSPSLLSMNKNEIPVIAVSHLRDTDPSGRDTNSAVIALTLGLSITAMLVALVGCRMNSIKRRIARRGGRSLAHDADYLINGMYL